MGDTLNLSSFRQENAEKVVKLSQVLEALDDHPLLRGNLALHGGTALNLFILDPERLSLDLDLSYIASVEREAMLVDRDGYIEAVRQVARSLGMRPRGSGVGHAGCTLKLGYEPSRPEWDGQIKVDLNFLNRSPLIAPKVATMRIHELGTDFLVTSPVEVVAGKLKAATERTVLRDLFDLTRIAESTDSWSTGNPTLDHRIVFYNATLSDRFPNHGPLHDPKRFEGREDAFEKTLLPVLPIGTKLSYADLMSASMPVLEHYSTPIDGVEAEYANALAHGSFDPSPLFEGHPQMQRAAAENPVALRKAQNIQDALAKHAFNPDDFTFRPTLASSKKAKVPRHAPSAQPTPQTDQQAMAEATKSGVMPHKAANPPIRT